MLPSISFRWITPERLRAYRSRFRSASPSLPSPRWSRSCSRALGRLGWCAHRPDDRRCRRQRRPHAAQRQDRGLSQRGAHQRFPAVKAGEFLVQIEDDDYKARVAPGRGRCRLGGSRDREPEVAQGQQHPQIAAAQSAITATQADVERTRLEALRQQNLVASTYGTRQRLEQATADEKRFQATKLGALRTKLEGRRSQMACSTRRNCSSAGRPQVEAGRASLARITRLHPDRGAGGRHGRRARRAHRPVCTAGHAGDLGRAARYGLGGRQLQGDAAHAGRHRPAGRASPSTPSRGLVTGPCRQHRAGERLAIHPLRPTTPPATSPRWSSVFQSRSCSIRGHRAHGQAAAGHVGDRHDPYRPAARP